ncbi:MAG: class I SAM-dependent methyltransferase [Mahellales bacterium]
MSFYSKLSQYYDYIFPAAHTTLDFLRDVFRKHATSSVLDLGCGSGNYSVEFARWGLSVTAVDLDSEMVAKAQAKAKDEDLPIEVIKGNMLNISDIIKENFDGIVCIGNSLVHLSHRHQISKALKEMNTLLKPGGVLILQIVNYDRVLKFDVRHLPVIRNDEMDLTFIREYSIDAETSLINFITTLKVGKNEYRNIIKLLPLKREELDRLLKESGFNNNTFYGSFAGDGWKEDTMATISISIK